MKTNKGKENRDHKLINRAKSFLENSQDTSTKDFLIYLCADFSFLLNGIFLVIISLLNGNISGNDFRSTFGAIFIAIWFIFLPNVSMDTKGKIMNHLVYSLITLFCSCIIIFYWLISPKNGLFIPLEIIIYVISIPTTSYLIYLLINFFKLIFLIIKKITNAILNTTEKSLLIRIFTAITFILVSATSLLSALWGIVTALKNFTN